MSSAQERKRERERGREREREREKERLRQREADRQRERGNMYREKEMVRGIYHELKSISTRCKLICCVKVCFGYAFTRRFIGHICHIVRQAIRFSVMVSQDPVHCIP